jgi:hypothetical protein
MRRGIIQGAFILSLLLTSPPPPKICNFYQILEARQKVI